jgi:hypothetical protein
MLILSVLASAAAGDRSCAAVAPSQAPQALTLRGHDYTLIGACGLLPVYQTARTDSTFLDRDAAESAAIILVTTESVEPTTAEDSWPAPPGNLYFSYPFPGSPEQARESVSAVLEAWWAEVAPGVAITGGWDGDYGAHRAPDGRFVTGLALWSRSARGHIPVGVDVHLGATPAQYAALGAEAGHVSLATLTGQSVDVDAALWAILTRLHDRAGGLGGE